MLGRKFRTPKFRSKFRRYQLWRDDFQWFVEVYCDDILRGRPLVDSPCGKRDFCVTQFIRRRLLLLLLFNTVSVSVQAFAFLFWWTRFHRMMGSEHFSIISSLKFVEAAPVRWSALTCRSTFGQAAQDWRYEKMLSSICRGGRSYVQTAKDILFWSLEATIKWFFGDMRGPPRWSCGQVSLNSSTAYDVEGGVERCFQPGHDAEQTMAVLITQAVSLNRQRSTFLMRNSKLFVFELWKIIKRYLRRLFCCLRK